ncbi:MAG: hypothetical protein ACK4FA_01330 [Candidatus Paceibacteria bacterium]
MKPTTHLRTALLSTFLCLFFFSAFANTWQTTDVKQTDQTAFSLGDLPAAPAVLFDADVFLIATPGDLPNISSNLVNDANATTGANNHADYEGLYANDVTANASGTQISNLLNVVPDDDVSCIIFSLNTNSAANSGSPGNQNEENSSAASPFAVLNSLQIAILSSGDISASAQPFPFLNAA